MWIFPQQSKFMADISTYIKERILLIAECLDISKEEFTASIGTSYGNFRGKSKYTSVSSDTIAEISAKYPQVNIYWVLTGEGEMLRSSNIVQGERNAVGNNQGTITGHNVGDNSINIAAPSIGKQKIIHPDRTIEIQQSTQDDSSLVELQEAYKLALTTIENQKLEITSLKDKVMDLQNKLIDKLEKDK